MDDATIITIATKPYFTFDKHITYTHYIKNEHTMKKTYSKPSSTIINFTSEGMMAQSLAIGGDSTVTSEDQVLSNGQGWSSDNWTADDED